MEISVFRADLRVTSKEKALEFYKCVKNVILIPADRKLLIRVEPNCCISTIPRSSVIDGTAPFIPSLRDENGMLAYRWRKYINAYLAR